MPSEVTELMKKLEILEEKNKALRTYIDHVESLMALWQKEHKESLQLELRNLKETLKHEVLEDVNERFEAMAKKEPSLWERVRLYFANKKMRSEVMKELL